MAAGNSPDNTSIILERQDQQIVLLGLTDSIIPLPLFNRPELMVVTLQRVKTAPGRLPGAVKIYSSLTISTNLPFSTPELIGPDAIQIT